MNEKITNDFALPKKSLRYYDIQSALEDANGVNIKKILNDSDTFVGGKLSPHSSALKAKFNQSLPFQIDEGTQRASTRRPSVFPVNFRTNASVWKQAKLNLLSGASLDPMDPLLYANGLDFINRLHHQRKSESEEECQRYGVPSTNKVQPLYDIFELIPYVPRRQSAISIPPNYLPPLHVPFADNLKSANLDLHVAGTPASVYLSVPQSLLASLKCSALRRSAISKSNQMPSAPNDTNSESNNSRPTTSQSNLRTVASPQISPPAAMVFHNSFRSPRDLQSSLKKLCSSEESGSNVYSSSYKNSSSAANGMSHSRSPSPGQWAIEALSKLLVLDVEILEDSKAFSGNRRSFQLMSRTPFFVSNPLEFTSSCLNETPQPINFHSVLNKSSKLHFLRVDVRPGEVRHVRFDLESDLGIRGILEISQNPTAELSQRLLAVLEDLTHKGDSIRWQLEGKVRNLCFNLDNEKNMHLLAAGPVVTQPHSTSQALAQTPALQQQDVFHNARISSESIEKPIGPRAARIMRKLVSADETGQTAKIVNNLLVGRDIREFGRGHHTTAASSDHEEWISDESVKFVNLILSAAEDLSSVFMEISPSFAKGHQLVVASLMSAMDQIVDQAQNVLDAEKKEMKNKVDEVKTQMKQLTAQLNSTSTSKGVSAETYAQLKGMYEKKCHEISEQELLWKTSVREKELLDEEIYWLEDQVALLSHQLANSQREVQILLEENQFLQQERLNLDKHPNKNSTSPLESNNSIRRRVSFGVIDSNFENEENGGGEEEENSTVAANTVIQSDLSSDNNNNNNNNNNAIQRVSSPNHISHSNSPQSFKRGSKTFFSPANSFIGGIGMRTTQDIGDNPLVTRNSSNYHNEFTLAAGASATIFKRSRRKQLIETAVQTLDPEDEPFGPDDAEMLLETAELFRQRTADYRIDLDGGFARSSIVPRSSLLSLMKSLNDHVIKTRSSKLIKLLQNALLSSDVIEDKAAAELSILPSIKDIVKSSLMLMSSERMKSMSLQCSAGIEQEIQSLKMELEFVNSSFNEISLHNDGDDMNHIIDSFKTHEENLHDLNGGIKNSSAVQKRSIQIQTEDQSLYSVSFSKGMRQATAASFRPEPPPLNIKLLNKSQFLQECHDILASLVSSNGNSNNNGNNTSNDGASLSDTMNSDSKNALQMAISSNLSSPSQTFSYHLQTFYLRRLGLSNLAQTAKKTFSATVQDYCASHPIAQLFARLMAHISTDLSEVPVPEWLRLKFALLQHSNVHFGFFRPKFSKIHGLPLSCGSLAAECLLEVQKVVQDGISDRKSFKKKITPYGDIFPLEAVLKAISNVITRQDIYHATIAALVDASQTEFEMKHPDFSFIQNWASSGGAPLQLRSLPAAKVEGESTVGTAVSASAQRAIGDEHFWTSNSMDIVLSPIVGDDDIQLAIENLMNIPTNNSINPNGSSSPSKRATGTGKNAATTNIEKEPKTTLNTILAEKTTPAFVSKITQALQSALISETIAAKAAGHKKAANLCLQAAISRQRAGAMLSFFIFNYLRQNKPLWLHSGTWVNELWSLLASMSAASAANSNNSSNEVHNLKVNSSGKTAAKIANLNTLFDFCINKLNVPISKSMLVHLFCQTGARGREGLTLEEQESEVLTLVQGEEGSSLLRVSTEDAELEEKEDLEGLLLQVKPAINKLQESPINVNKSIGEEMSLLSSASAVDSLIEQQLDDKPEFIVEDRSLSEYLWKQAFLTSSQFTISTTWVTEWSLLWAVAVGVQHARLQRIDTVSTLFKKLDEMSSDSLRMNPFENLVLTLLPSPGPSKEKVNILFSKTVDLTQTLLGSEREIGTLTSAEKVVSCSAVCELVNNDTLFTSDAALKSMSQPISKLLRKLKMIQSTKK